MLIIPISREFGGGGREPGNIFCPYGIGNDLKQVKSSAVLSEDSEMPAT